MKIIINGVTGLQNRGVEALLQPSVHALQKRLPSCEITIATHTLDYDRELGALPNVTWLSDSYGGSSPNWKSWAKKTIKILLGGNQHSETAFKQSLTGANMLITTGGDVFCSEYGDFSGHLAPIKRAIQAGVKTVLLAQSIGPFRTQDEIQRFCGVAEKVDLITVRESLTYNYCLNELGLSPDQIKLTVDPGFLLKPAANWENLQHACGLTDQAPYAAFSMSSGITRYSGLGKGEHLQAWSAAIQWVLELGLPVLLIPHVQRWGVLEDDRIIATELMRQFNYHPKLHLAGWNASAAELKALISGAELILAERMHAAIAGISMGRPTGVIGYSVKSQGILGDVYGEELASTYLIEAAEFLQKTPRQKWLESCYGRREQLAAALAPQLANLRSRAELNFDLIAEVLAVKAGKA